MASTVETSGINRKRKPAQRLATPRKALKVEHASGKQEQDLIALYEKRLQESSRHYNNLALLLTIAKKEVKLALSAVPAVLALCRAFCRLQAQGRLSKPQAKSDEGLKIVEWLRERYADYKKLLLRMVTSSNPLQQEMASTLAMQLIREDCASSASASNDVLRSGLFSQFLSTLLHIPQGQNLCDSLVDKYAQAYDDLRYYTFGAVVRALTTEASKATPTVISNCLAVLMRIEPLSSEEGKTIPYFAEESDEHIPRKRLGGSAQRKQAQQAWLTLLGSPLSKDQRKAILASMTYRVLPWFQNVEILMDFMTDSYNAGGATSLLALSGLFHLMQEKNLDYPDFFLKLYSLLDEQLLHSKHRSRFFRLLNTFMSSTHLPAAIAASFIKRLSRLALHAPPAGVVAVVPWVYNMLKGHPACTFMIHRVPRTDEERQALEDEGLYDCFDPDETDPMKTGAIDSCLWELETLQSHYHPNVASLARIISEQFTKTSYNLDDFLDHSYNSVSSEWAFILRESS